MRGSSHDACTDTFQKFCDGDDVAVRWVLDRFGPLMLKLIERRLGGRALRRRIDPDDVLQSALLNFYRWRNRRERRVESLRDFARLLISLCLHAVKHAIEYHTAERRNVARVSAIPVEVAAAELCDPHSRAGESRKLRHGELKRLSGELRILCEQRLAGCSWSELGASMGITGDALRKRVQRALVREIKCGGTAEP